VKINLEIEIPEEWLEELGIDVSEAQAILTDFINREKHEILADNSGN
jgi:hypothetical protein